MIFLKKWYNWHYLKLAREIESADYNTPKKFPAELKKVLGLLLYQNSFLMPVILKHSRFFTVLYYLMLNHDLIC